MPLVKAVSAQEIDDPKPHVVIQRVDRAPVLEEFLDMSPPRAGVTIRPGADSDA